jgi:hypothetical protein
MTYLCTRKRKTTRSNTYCGVEQLVARRAHIRQLADARSLTKSSEKRL